MEDKPKVDGRTKMGGVLLKSKDRRKTELEGKQAANAESLTKPLDIDDAISQAHGLLASPGETPQKMTPEYRKACEVEARICLGQIKSRQMPQHAKINAQFRLQRIKDRLWVPGEHVVDPSTIDLSVAAARGK